MAVVLMILGFIWWWPLGLIILGFLIAHGRFGRWRRPIYAGDRSMSDWDCSVNWDRRMDRWERKMARAQEKVERARAMMDGFKSRSGWFGSSSSGNHAFDDYRAE